MGVFPQIIQEFLGVAPESCIWIEYVFSGVLFLATFLGLMFFICIFLFSIFGILRK